MAAAVYTLCTLMSTLCAVLLFRQYVAARTRLLLWSGLSFGAMAVSNALVFVDLVMWETRDLSLVRAATMVIAAALLLYGLVADGE